MNRRELLGTAALTCIAAGLTGPSLAAPHRRATTARIGADIPWTTYQAEEMKTTGVILGPVYAPFRVEMESSQQRCVKLAAGQYVEFTVRAPANALVVRYSLPDSADGNGIASTLLFSRNGTPLRGIPVTSRYTWVYGDYPFTNNPAAGKPRKFYDEARVKGLMLAKGDVIRLEKPDDAAAYCIIDLVDLELVAPPLRHPPNAVSAVDFGADPAGHIDSTEAVRACLAAAANQGKIAFVPPGDYKLTGDIVLPSNVTLQGAGMWHTTFVGDEELYIHANRRLRFKLTGTNSHLADFALLGKLKYRNDDEQNDGIFGAHGENCIVSRLWVEHTKVGMWFYVCDNIVIKDCRLRNLLADGINLCVDVRNCVIQNCTARNTGDDCFAIWPAVSDQSFTEESPRPGNNVIRRCTGELPFLANGGAIYGGASNRIEDCLFTDITSGCGILISTTFPTSDGKTDNNFSGTTAIRDCRLVRCGGYDHDWTWRAAFQICLDRYDIAGLRLNNIEIKDSFSDGFAVVTGPKGKAPHTLTDVRLENISISNYAIGAARRHGLWIEEKATGRMTLARSKIANIRNDSRTFQIFAE